jgi:hypothetical protein
MTEAFEVHPHHLVRVCDTVLGGGIQRGSLEASAFALSRQMHFTGTVAHSKAGG